MKKINIGRATLSALMLTGAATVSAQSGLELKAGFNAVEAGVTSQGDLRTRAYTNVGLVGESIRVDYHGMNEVTASVRDGYFGRETLMLGSAKNQRVKLATVAKLVSKDGRVELLDLKLGARIGLGDLSKIIDYGFADLTADGDGANMTVFAGKNLGKGVTIEATHSLEKPYHAKPRYFTEVEAFRSLGKKVSAFFRYQTSHEPESGTFIGGLMYQR